MPRLLLAVIAALLVSAAPAHAAQCTVRWQPGLFGGPGSMVPVCDGGASSAQPKAKARTEAERTRRTPTRAQLRALRFTPRESVTAAVTDRLAGRFTHPEGPDALRAELQRVAPLAQSQRGMRALKLDPRDLGDAYTHAFIVLWTVVNGRPTVSEKAFKGVREDLRAQLALDPRVRRASDAQQQAAAEWLGSWAGIMATSWNGFVQSGDRAAADAWREQARKLAAERDLFGVDLSKLRLTSRGVAKR